MTVHEKQEEALQRVLLPLLCQLPVFWSQYDELAFNYMYFSNPIAGGNISLLIRPRLASNGIGELLSELFARYIPCQDAQCAVCLTLASKTLVVPRPSQHQFAMAKKKLALFYAEDTVDREEWEDVLREENACWSLVGPHPQNAE